MKKALDRIIEWQESRAAKASQPKVVVSGFYTDEVLDESGSRVGFDVVGVASKKRGILSRKRGLPSSYPQTGKYTVDVASFEGIALSELDVLQSSPTEVDACDRDTIQIIILDEIGRMELHSKKFEAAVETLLRHPNILLVGAVTAPIYGHRVPFCDYITDGYELKKHSMLVEVMRIKKSNREAVTRDYMEKLEVLLSELEGREGSNKRRRIKS